MAYLYLSLAAEHCLACYRIDPGTGDLELFDQVAVPGEPSVQGTDPKRRFLYAAMRSTGQIVSFAIDAASGRLQHLHTLDTGLEDPAYLRTDHTGRFLLTPYYASGKVTLYPIGADGTARAPVASVVDTAPHAHGIALSTDNRHVFVPHTCPGNGIWQLLLEEGQLRLNAVSKVGFDHDRGPRHAHFHPNGRLLYSVDEQGNSVTTYQYDADTGTLTPGQSLSTVPPDHQGGACARMELHPSGRFLYAANRGHDSIAVFIIDPDTGALTANGQVPTAANPRSFDMDPSGRFLYAAGESADRLIAYRIDPEDGALQAIKTYTTGRIPWWVHIVEPGRAA
ncbi:MAG: beta-propeller fold lactonase family protein [Candidatus Latescibacteria bacterium]|nr:beta-propeller fold lactonase family protein [Candidatus Latescibacterota bacterium]